MIVEDYLHLAQDADRNVDRLRWKRYEELVQLAEALKRCHRAIAMQIQRHSQLRLRSGTTNLDHEAMDGLLCESSARSASLHCRHFGARQTANPSDQCGQTRAVLLRHGCEFQSHSLKGRHVPG